ncbi:MAG: response regulator transcription factor [Dehalococcoidia bacterium]|nr:response regulator transcription factor [Dehalococcoidia bacterium]
MHVLLAEDDRRLARVVARVLTEDGHVVDVAHAGDDALALASEDTFDVLVLDVMMPGLDGFAVLDALRRTGVATPVLMLTAKGEVEDRVRGLDLGADDYLTKPFALEELQARVRACGRRRAELQPEVLRVGDLEVDLGRHEVRRDGERVELAPTEWRLLEFLARHRGRTFSRGAILAGVWGYDEEPVESNVDLYVHYLRRKLGAASPIRTVRGVGYRIDGV